MNAFLEDLRYALRTLRQRPGFTLVAVVTLGLGIGLNTAIFTVVDHVILADPPYRSPEQIMMLRATAPPPDPSEPPMELPWSYPLFSDFRDVPSPFEQIAGYAPWDFNLTGTEWPERISAEMVTDEYFDLLGVEAAVGRVMSPGDAEDGTESVAVLGHDLWQRRFQGDPEVIGETIRLDGIPLTVIGVAPRSFRGLSGKAEAWAPMDRAPALTANPNRLKLRFAFWHEAVARVRPGITPKQAEEAAAEVLGRVFETNPAGGPLADLEVHPVPLEEDRVDTEFQRSLLLLFGAVGFVLVIACVNVVNLLLVRVMGRQREVAIRMALGSTRRRLLQLFVTESVVLGVLGGLFGLLVAYGGLQLFEVARPVAQEASALGSAGLEAMRLDEVGIGLRVLAVNFLFAVLAGCLVGLLPALRAAKVEINEWIKEGLGGLKGSLRGLRRPSALNLLVVAEIALSLLLLIGAGLLIRNFVRLYAIDLGFEPRSLLTLKLSDSALHESDAETGVFYERLMDEIKALPGVESATVTNRLPLSVRGEASPMKVRGRSYEEGAEPVPDVLYVTAGYFRALDIPVVAGRAFTEQARAGTRRVALVNRAAADRFFGGDSAVGQQIRLGIGWEEDEYAEIVGVVGDVRYGKVEEAPGAAVYVPFLQNPSDRVTVVVKAAAEPDSLVRPIRETVTGMAPSVPIFDVQLMEEHISDAMSRFRFSALLLSVFAGVAFLLAAVGLYGVMAHSVSGRTLEIGVRMALGARRGEVSRMLLGEGLRLAAVGLALGVILALALNRVASSFLYDLDATDPATFAAVAVLLGLVSLVAIYLPSRRALKVEPRSALRNE